jgi:hypothetical protein
VSKTSRKKHHSVYNTLAALVAMSPKIGESRNKSMQMATITIVAMTAISDTQSGSTSDSQRGSSSD